MNNETKFYSISLFQHNDYIVSSNIFKIESFFYHDQWGISPPKLKISIQNFKSKLYENVILDFQNIGLLLNKIKFFNDSYAQYLKELEKNNSTQKTIFINSKKNLYITFLYKSEYQGPCFRIIISDKNDGFLDTEKVYMTLNDFLSFSKVIVLFRDNYIYQANENQKSIESKETLQKIQELSEKITSYYLESKTINKKNNFISEQFLNEKKEEQFDVTNLEIDCKEEKNVDNVNLEEMNKFVNDNYSQTELQIPQNIYSEKKLVSTDVVSKSFTVDLLKNDFSNLEILINNIINDDVPFRKINEYIHEKLNFNPLTDIDENDINKIDYLISCFLKQQLKNLIEKNQKLPNSTTPIILTNLNVNEEKMSLVYDIFLYIIYLTQIKNSLQDKDFNSVKNKDMFSFVLKMIFSPVVFSYVMKCEKKSLSSEITRRYDEYIKNKVFDTFESKIKTQFSFIPNITSKIIQDEVERIYDALKENLDKCTVEKTFTKFKTLKCIKLDYGHFNNSFSEEQIKKLIQLELNFQKNQKIVFEEIDCKDFSDIDLKILQEYGISEVKFDNTNLIRLIKENCKNSDDIEYCTSIVKKIKDSYFDLKNEEIDFEKIPEKVLKGVYLWDLQRDKKIAMNYSYFLNLVENSSLEKDNIISIFVNLESKKKDDFIGSFIAAKEDF